MIDDLPTSDGIRMDQKVIMLQLFCGIALKKGPPRDGHGVAAPFEKSGETLVSIRCPALGPNPVSSSRERISTVKQTIRFRRHLFAIPDGRKLGKSLTHS
jgi:hypothetical protein